MRSDVRTTLGDHDQLRPASGRVTRDGRVARVIFNWSKYRDRGVPKDSLELVSEAALFSGSRSRTTICVCPALSEWIAEEMRKEAAIMKERKKAREERNLAKPPK